MYKPQSFPPLLQCVATLPCEIRKSKMLPNLQIERNN